MNGTAARFLRLGVSLSGLVVLGWVLTGQAAKPAPEGLPTDWSHRHVIFSQPATFQQVRQITSDPRYWQQWYRRNVVRVLSEDGSDQAPLEFSAYVGSPSRPHRDWSQNLGSGAKVGAANYPAKYSFQIVTASCGGAPTPDFVTFGTGLLGAAGQASIVAYDNLYSGCSGPVPSVYWAYNTGGEILTSPVISSGGTQIGFVQTDGFGAASLVLLKWAASTTETVASPGTPTSVAPGAYMTCTAPCMTTFSLRDGSNVVTDDTTSSVFYDYQTDTAWVGDSRNWLHKFNPVFKATPAEIRTAPWPVQLNPGNALALSSPVHDLVSGNVFVGDYGGFFYRVSATTGAVTRSLQVDFGTGIVAGPIVDSTAGKVYVFSSSDGTSACIAGTPCSAVFLFGTGFAANTSGSEVVVGASQAAPPNPNPLFDGGFDSTYHASVNATGNLYVCGNTGGPPILYQVPIAAGVWGTPVSGPPLATGTAACSPVTDVPNPNATGGTSEWIFASAHASGSGNNCAAGGCIMNFKVQPWKPSTLYVAGQEVLDNHFQIQVVRVGGTSKAGAHPVWNTTVDGNTTDGDGTLRWTNQGPLASSYAAWAPSTVYALHAEILDSNGRIQAVTTAGTSKAGTHPVWGTTVNALTADNTVRWRMVGALATASLPAAGGSSGIIMDNIVGSVTQPGASQVYFSTQSNQPCGTSGTGGCAVQASQSALQ